VKAPKKKKTAMYANGNHDKSRITTAYIGKLLGNIEIDMSDGKIAR
jgi:hypothetical protein